MRHAFLDRYGRLESPIHRIPAGRKLAAALVLITSVVVAPANAVWFFATMAFFLLIVGFASCVPPFFLLTRLLLFEPVIIGVAVLRLWGPNGWESFLIIFTKSTLSLFTMVLLTNTTPFVEILSVLKRVRFPSIFITILALMYRYLFVLIDEAERMQKARRSRTFAPSRTLSWRLLGSTAGQLFIRSSERAERIYAAMCARGWK